MPKIKVIVVDDSALVRSLLSSIINRQADMECIGTACDPLVAREMIREKNPDVITLDVEMPHMDGLDFLGRLMRLRPMPVVMISTLTEAGADVTMRALELGAVDFVTKPQIGQTEGINALAEQIVEKLRIAAAARVNRRAPPAAAAPTTPAAPKGQPAHSRAASRRLIALGASTGGTEAIRDVLIQLGSDSPGVVITQHMPPRFTSSFAQRLDACCALRVREAQDGEVILDGHAYVAPGGMHLRVESSSGHFVARVDDAAPVNRHRPSVDVLFDSVARAAGPHCVAALLTGMGSDGAQGLRSILDAGGQTIAQDEASCVVFGMPREAVRLGAAQQVLPLARIGSAITDALSNLKTEATAG